MDLELRGKTAIVTGSTAGIGHAIAAALAAEGATVVVNGRDENRVAETVARLQQSYPEATVFTATHAAHCHLYEHAVTKAVI